MTALRALFAKHPLWVLFTLFVAAYAAVFAMFVSEGHPKTRLTGIDKGAVPIVVHILNLDLVRDLATFTLVPDTTSAELATKGRLIADITLEIELGSSVLSHTFKKGDSPAPWTANVPIEFGDALDFPFDRHGGDLLLKAKRAGATSTQVSVDLDKVSHGYVASMNGEPTHDQSQVELSFQVARSPAVIFLSLMAMISLTLVVFSAVNVAIQVALHGRKVEFGMLVWIAALLFVIPSVRNGLPGSPPAGALVDIALFFWLHILGVGSLLTVVTRWKRQT
jgi:hypothetical protein